MNRHQRKEHHRLDNLARTAGEAIEAHWAYHLDRYVVMVLGPDSATLMAFGFASEEQAADAVIDGFLTEGIGSPGAIPDGGGR